MSSDTDDTDALLSCDPGGGLHALLEGLTMDDVCSSSQSLADSQSQSPDKSGSNSKSKNNANLNGTLPKDSKNSINSGGRGKDKESSLEISDFFNSDGELVLSGLSQFSETSVSFSTVDGEGKEEEKEKDKGYPVVRNERLNDNGGGPIKDEESGRNSTSTGSRSGEEEDRSDGTGTGTSCTVESNTVVPVPPKTKVGIAAEHSNTVGGGDSHKISNKEPQPGPSSRSGQSTSTSASTSNLEVVKVDKRTVPREVQDDLKRQLVQANDTNPEIQDWIENHSSQISYGVLNLNLNDLKSFAEGLHRCDFFPKTKSEKVSTFVPTRNEKGEQIFTRAPNFRRPGGYKPPRNPRKCRDLTEEQIREEVRKMYEFPDADDEDDTTAEEGDSQSRRKNVNFKHAEDKKSTKDKDKDSTKDRKPEEVLRKSPVHFNFLSDTSITSEFEFGKGKSGKPMKRKLLPNSGRVCGGTVGSIPDLGFGLRNIGSDEVEVKEPTVERTKTWVTASSSAAAVSLQTGDYSERGDKVNDMNKSNGNSNGVDGSSSGNGYQRSTFSFGYGEEEDSLSPIKSTLGPRVSSSLLQSARVLTSPDSAAELSGRNVNKNTGGTASSDNGNLTSSASDSDAIIREESRILKDLSGKPLVLPIPSLSSFEKPATPKRRPIRKAASKLKGMMMASPRYSENQNHPVPSTSTSDRVTTGPLASDLEKILSEIELPAEQIESLIENLDDEDLDLAKIQLFDDIPEDGDLPDAFSQLNLGAWRSVEDDTLTEKYHCEKFKREQCEKELRSLQESFLNEKQHTAVLEGTLKKKNLMLVQITMAFNRVCSEWTKFATENKEAVNKLQRDQKILANACKRSRDRISQYEKELHKTLELADSFKSQLSDVQQERDSSVLALKEANSELEDKIKKLKEDMECLKTERDATLRALRESQIKLDEGKHAVENMESHIKALELKDIQSTQKYDELLHAKSLQDSNYLEVVERRNELEALVMNLTTELSMEKSSKDKMKRDFQEEADRKSKADAERLHDYYNKKVQEILKSATEEAARAEAVLKEQMKKAALDSEKKLSECKERFQRELEVLKARYEAEIEKLKRENLHRQLLISSTVKQLQMGESPNLDVNSLTLQSRIPQLSRHKNDILDVLKTQTQSNSEMSENFYKGGSSGTSAGVSQLTKFTLNHLPSIISTHHQTLDSKGNGNYNSFQNYVPFEPTGNFSRFKTSTPVESHSDMSGQVHGPAESDTCGSAGDFRKVCNSQYSSEDPSHKNTDKVCSEKSVNANNNASSSTPYTLDLKNVLSHLLEVPTKPEKEQQQMNSNIPSGKLTETSLDPTIQKCIQDLLKCYAEKEKVQDTRISDKDKDSIVSTTMSNQNENFNLNKIVVSVSNTDNQSQENGEPPKSLNANSISESQASQSMSHSCSGSSSKTESRCRSKSSKSDGNGSGKDQQSTGNVKPPWK